MENYKYSAIYCVKGEYEVVGLVENKFTTFTRTYNGAKEVFTEVINDFKEYLNEAYEKLEEEEIDEDFIRLDGEYGSYIILSLSKEVVEER